MYEPSKRKRKNNKKSSKTSPSTTNKEGFVLLTKIFDGQSMVDICKPVHQSKITTRDLDPTGQEIMRKISKLSPLYLATKNAFPDSGATNRRRFCRLMFKKAVKSLKKKFPDEPRHIERLDEALNNYKIDDIYRKLLGVLVSISLLC